LFGPGVGWSQAKRPNIDLSRQRLLCYSSAGSIRSTETEGGPMIRNWSLAVWTTLVLASAAAAQTPGWRFHWQAGQVLTYRVDQVTSASEVVEGKKTETTSKLANVKRWQVLDVDAAGVATLQLSLTSLRIETITPGGEVMKFDSNEPQTSNPQMREQLAKYVN